MAADRGEDADREARAGDHGDGDGERVHVLVLGAAEAHEEIVACDLADAQAVHDLVKDCDGIIHLGGV